MVQKQSKIYKNNVYIKTFIVYPLILVFLVLTSASYRYNTKAIYGVKRVVINAGHGGKDCGTNGVHVCEKEVALKISNKLGKFIKESFPEVELYFTRDDDRFVELNDIANHANKSNADLFICIHCNANPNKEISGAETYVMGLHKTKGNLDVAKRENATILLEDNYKQKYDGFDPSSEEATIIFSMFQDAFLDNSLLFASKVQEQFKSYAKRTDRGVKQAGFLVLWKTKMPSVLIETGFLSNKTEERYLMSDKGQTQLAYSIFRAFREYKYDLEGKKLSEKEKNEKIPAEWEFKDDEVKKESGKEGTLEDKTQVEKSESKLDSTKKEQEKVETSTEVKKEVKDEKTLVAEYGLIFRVQLMHTAKKQSKSKFKDFEDYKEVESEGDYRYYVGNCKSVDDVNKLNADVKKKGFNDAFPVAFKNGKRITMQEARELLDKK